MRFVLSEIYLFISISCKTHMRITNEMKCDTYFYYAEGLFESVIRFGEQRDEKLEKHHSIHLLLSHFLSTAALVCAGSHFTLSK